jgi:hypothetical protein
MGRTIRQEKFKKRDVGAMTLAYGKFRNSHHGDVRKEESANECRKFKFNNDESKED